MEKPDGNHGFTHAEISYGAFCISQEEARQGKHSGRDAHWFAAIERLARKRTKGAGPKTCYMCDSPPTSVEHVPPKCFFPEKKDLPDGVDYRQNLFTVPSCDVHNTEKSKHDTYVLALVAAYFANNQQAKDHYGTKILRALKKSTGFAHCVLTGSEKVTFGGEETKALKVDTPRFLQELQHMAKALYFQHFGTRCPHPVQVHTPMLHDENKQPREDIKALFKMVRPVIDDAQAYGDNSAIFHYRLAALPGTAMTLIKMTFYQGAEVLAICSPGLMEE